MAPTSKVQSERLVHFSSSSTRIVIAKAFHVHLESRFDVLLISTDGHFVHMLIKDKIAATVRCKKRVLDGCLVFSKCRGVSLYLLECSGTVLSLPVDLFTNKASHPSGEGDFDKDDVFSDLLQGSTAGPGGASLTTSSAQSLLVQEGASKLACIGDYICTLVDTPHSYTVFMYQEVLVPGSSGSRVERVGSYRVAKSAAGNLAESDKMVITMVLACPNHHDTSHMEVLYHGDLQLDLELYGQLCGPEVALMRRPLLMLGLVSGHVYIIPIGDLKSVAPYQSLLVCDIRQPVCAIYGLAAGNSCCGPFKKLVVLGELGKIMVVERSAEMRTVSCEVSIMGPVQCSVCLPQDVLVHSSAGLTYVTKLHQVETAAAHSHLNSNVYRAGQACCLLPSTVQDGEDKSACWMSLTRTGLMYRHTLLTNESPVSSAACIGRPLKDLLTGIAQTTDRLDQLKEATTSLDTVITQIALLGCVLAESASNVPFRLVAQMQKRRLGGKIELLLQVKLTNVSSITLDASWSLTLILIPSIRNPGATHSSRVGRLSQLAQGEYYTMELPLTEKHLQGIPLTLRAFVSYCPQLPAIAGQTLAPVTLPLSTLTIDALWGAEAAPTSPRAWSDFQSSSTETRLMEVASKRPCWKMHSESLREKFVMTKDPKTSRVCIETKTFKELLSKQELVSKQKGQPLEALLLRHLLVDTDVELDPTQTRTTLLIIATHRQVTLTVTVSKNTKERLEVAMDADDLRTLAQVHTAVQSRLRALGRQVWALKDRIYEMQRPGSQLIQEALAAFTTLRNIVW